MIMTIAEYRNILLRQKTIYQISLENAAVAWGKTPNNPQAAQQLAFASGQMEAIQYALGNLPDFGPTEKVSVQALTSTEPRI